MRGNNLRPNGACRSRRLGRRRKLGVAEAKQKRVAQEQRAAETEQKRVDAEASQRRAAQMDAEVASLNSQLVGARRTIESMLAVSLRRDHYIELESKRRVVEHPPFPGPIWSIQYRHQRQSLLVQNPCGPNRSGRPA